MNNNTKELVKARYEFFLSVGYSERVAMDMATFQFPDGNYFHTPVDK